MKVFLGGTCNGSNWREKIIPKLKIGYFNPVVENWDESAKQKELLEREECDIVLYTITPKMKGVYSIAEAVDDSNKRPKKTIFCVLNHDINDTMGFYHNFDTQQLNSLYEVGNMIKRNGGYFVHNLDTLVKLLNNFKEGD